MADELIHPFSAQTRGPHARIDNDFPLTARIGLFHIISDLITPKYVAGWAPVLNELQRIARLPPSRDGYVLQILMELPWEKVLDFCQRLYSNLLKEVGHTDNYDQWIVETPKSAVQEYFTRELSNLFLEEHLAFEFSNGVVVRKGRRNTTEQIGRAERVLGDPQLVKARTHYNKALGFFRSISKPDYENCVKEAVCAVEAAARALFSSGGATLGDVVKSITGSDMGQLPKAIANTFHGLYGFRSGGEGVGHGGTTGGPATKEIAEYALAVSASQIVLLVDLAAAAEPDIPF